MAPPREPNHRRVRSLEEAKLVMAVDLIANGPDIIAHTPSSCLIRTVDPESWRSSQI
jgi:hypothetical protein